MGVTGAAALVAASVRKSKHLQDEIRTDRDRRRRDDDNFVAKRGIGFRQTLLFGERVGKTVLSLGIGHIDFRPGRGHEDPAAIAMRHAERHHHRRTGAMLEGHRGIHQTSIEKDAAFRPPERRISVSDRHCDRAPSESGQIKPGKRTPLARPLLGDNAATGFRDDRIASPLKFREQAGFPAAGTSRYNDEMVQVFTKT